MELLRSRELSLGSNRNHLLLWPFHFMQGSKLKFWLKLPLGLKWFPERKLWLPPPCPLLKNYVIFKTTDCTASLHSCHFNFTWFNTIMLPSPKSFCHDWLFFFHVLHRFKCRRCVNNIQVTLPPEGTDCSADLSQWNHCADRKGLDDVMLKGAWSSGVTFVFHQKSHEKQLGV